MTEQELIQLIQAALKPIYHRPIPADTEARIRRKIFSRLPVRRTQTGLTWACPYCQHEGNLGATCTYCDQARPNVYE